MKKYKFTFYYPLPVRVDIVDLDGRIKETEELLTDEEKQLEEGLKKIKEEIQFDVVFERKTLVKKNVIKKYLWHCWHAEDYYRVYIYNLYEIEGYAVEERRKSVEFWLFHAVHWSRDSFIQPPPDIQPYKIRVKRIEEK